MKMTIRDTNAKKIIGALLYFACSWQGILAYAATDYEGLQKLYGEPVTTSVTGKPMRVNDAPANIVIISHEEIQNSGALDIPELLRRVAGLQVRRSYIGGVDVGIRSEASSYSNEILTLIDGRQIYADFYGVTFWNNLPIQLSEIQQIEIVKGPNSSLFGFNAAAGVINIITKNPAFDASRTNNIELSGGSQGYGEASFTRSIAHRDSSVRFSGGYRHLDGFDRDYARYESKDALQKGAFHVDYHKKIDNFRELRMQTGYSRSEIDEVSPIFNAASRTSIASSFVHGVFAHEKGSLTHNFRYYSNIDKYNSNPAGRFSPTNWVDNPSLDSQMHSVDYSTLWAASPLHTFRFAGNLRHSMYDGDLLSRNSEREVSNSLASSSIMWDWVVHPKVSLTNAIRYDYSYFRANQGVNFAGVTLLDLPQSAYDNDVNGFTYNSGLVYRFADHTSLRLNAGRGLHMPSIVEMNYALRENGQSPQYGNPFMSPEKFTNYELGVDHEFVDSNIKLGVSVFHLIRENNIELTSFARNPFTTGLFSEALFNNAGDSKSNGFEVQADYHFNDLKLGLNYSYLDINKDFDSSSRHSQHKISGWFGMKISENIDWNSDLHYVSSSHTAFEYPILVVEDSESIPAYWIFNTAVNYRLDKDTKLSLIGFNLLDEHREIGYSSTVIYPFIPGFSQASVYGGEEIGRAVWLRFAKSF
ncbi:hypothetical protein C7B61_00095 [filamentous cyanobacterium CCP1]|nr:hypothetical protein C7B61_00095 [filamentous cyanobacterium CCP1]